VVVPPRRVHLDVHADHVAGDPLEELHVERRRGVAGRREDAVRPVALVQRTDLEDGLVVQADPREARRVLRQGNLPHAEVAGDLVGDLPGILEVAERDADVVEERIIRRPGLGVLDRHFDSRQPAAGRDFLGPVQHDDIGLVRLGDELAVEFDDQPAVVQVGRQLQPGDPPSGHRLQPHRLPDARRGGVAEALSLFRQRLLSDGLVADVGRVPDAQDDLVLAVLAGGQRVGDVEGERVVTPLVVADLHAVDPDPRVPVDGLEVQHDPPPGPAGRNLERPPVPQKLVGADDLLDARQDRLDAERDEDLAVPLPRRRRLQRVERVEPGVGDASAGPWARFALDGVVPQAVQVQPLLADHLRAGVLRPGVLARHVLRPARLQRRDGPAIAGRGSGLPALAALGRRLRRAHRGGMHDVHVDVLSSPRLPAVDGEHVRALLQCGDRPRVKLQPHRSRRVFCRLRRQHAVDVDLGVLVVVDLQARILQDLARDLHLTADPYLIGRPSRPDRAAVHIALAEAARPTPPGRIVEVRLEPPGRRFRERVSPHGGLLAAGGGRCPSRQSKRTGQHNRHRYPSYHVPLRQTGFRSAAGHYSRRDGAPHVAFAPANALPDQPLTGPAAGPTVRMRVSVIRTNLPPT